MASPLPKWVMTRYSILWNKFKEKEFYHEDALSLLKEKDERNVSLIIANLKKNGWIIVKLDPKDSRKRIYQLLSPENAVNEMKNKFNK